MIFIKSAGIQVRLGWTGILHKHTLKISASAHTHMYHKLEGNHDHNAGLEKALHKAGISAHSIIEHVSDTRDVIFHAKSELLVHIS